MQTSFWSTVPGILTAVAAIMGATATLVTALYAAGLIGSKKKAGKENAGENGDEAPDKRLEVSRDFIVGRWEVEQKFGELSGETIIEYKADGGFTGWITQFVGETGQKKQQTGKWDCETLSKKRFILRVQFEDQSTWAGTFRMIDENQIHNIDENYIAVRVE
jgi:hypothetical protein